MIRINIDCVLEFQTSQLYLVDVRRAIYFARAYTKSSIVNGEQKTCTCAKDALQACGAEISLKITI